jgi:hypothetical protein
VAPGQQIPLQQTPLPDLAQLPPAQHGWSLSPHATQLPFWHTRSVPQVVPLVLVSATHVPPLQTWQAGQTTGLLPVQTPPWQVSVWAHGLPSSHAVPSGLAGLEQSRVLGSQVPA